MLNVKYVIVRDGTPLPEGKFELAFDAEGDLSLYRNTNFMPRAWIVHQARLASDVENALMQVQAADFDPLTTVVLLDGDGLQGATPFGPLPEPPPIGDSQATVNTATDNTLTITVDAATPGFLVLSELWYPGWQATVYGTEQRTQHAILHANGSLPRRSHSCGQVDGRSTFQPTGWRLGRAFAGLGMLSIAVLNVATQRCAPTTAH